MRLQQLLDGFVAQPVPEALEAGALTLDSRQVGPGSVFFALAGTREHGLAYAPAAAKAGAVAVVYDPEAAGPLPSLTIPCIAVPELSARVGELAARFYGHPAEQMTLVGVTGTDGKTSVVTLWTQLMRACGFRVGSLGTLGLDLGEGVHGSTHTTPDPITLQAQLAAARDAGCTALAMEVSSHAIAQDRVAGLRFAHVALTNLGRDHLDYHQSVAEYHETKRRLLAWPGLESVHLNGDAPLVRRAHEVVMPGVACHYFGASTDARWCAQLTSPVPAGLKVQLAIDAHTAELALPLYGEFNVSNVLAAASLAEACGADIAALLAAIPTLQTVPGRMQSVREPGRPIAIIDYAHTPQALEAALQAVRAHRPAHLVCVFGCGGDRDRGKRPLMGAVAEKLADRVFLTDDNPRTEDPEQIFVDIQAGFTKTRRVRAIHDRGQAIREAIGGAQAEDIVLIAGKGHEDYQLIGRQRRDFCDITTARAVLRGEAA